MQFFATGSAAANTGGKVTFTWKANPPRDRVVGYRLYYGGTSRYKSRGGAGKNFRYDYYIDFAKRKRCVPGVKGGACRTLKPDELRCKGLKSEYPTCTISNLHGHLFFALTAYNTRSESGYTPELGMTVNPEGLAAVQTTVQELLLRKRSK
ncbi:MAG: hypothetical protein Kow0089_09350 [Desulfobulbaceae bacterium]